MRMGSMQLQELMEAKRSMEARCLAAAGELKGPVAFSGRTAVVLLGAELPRELRLVPDRLERVVNDVRKRNDTDAIACRMWNGLIEMNRVKANVWRVTAECAWTMMGAEASLEELVVLGECLMRRDRRLKRMTLESLQEYLHRLEEWGSEHRRRQVRGWEKCHKALRIMREDTDSSQESRMRLLLLRRGFGNAEVNVRVENSLRGGHFYLDAAFKELGIALEYDGRHHAAQWAADVNRRKDLEDMGWIVIQVTQEDLENPEMIERLVDRVANAVRERSGCDFHPVPPLTDAQLFDGRRWRRQRAWWSC
ncbi:hypothetical protein BCUN_1649 [Bifidobacterium cuniculi]|uniref:DUF559 domain-containing protein n=2 Tax=Bifidobacterium cuniculi TaxID=1688 RepID=A0A087AKK8_9BIFI|nr:hypothetical protein BCUN_1649 [Bifidobacterium cuniculi]